MKKYLYTGIILCCTFFSFAQIPNSGFENWNSSTIHLPTGWQTFGHIDQSTPSTEGSYALRMECINPTTGPGAIIYGNPQGSQFLGGIPFADRPDSLIANFKYKVMPGDSAWILVMLKNNGVLVSQNFNYLTGVDTSSFTRMAFNINYLSGLTPDSLIIGFTSSNPNNPQTGGFLIIDDVHFTNTLLTVPNGGFENWISILNEEPIAWTSPNQGLLMNPTLPVTKTTDKHSGAFAARIENVNSPGGLQMGFLLAGPQGQNGLAPGFAITERDSAFNGFYKFYPQNHDTVTIGVFMYSAGVQVGWGIFQDTSTASSYTPFTVPIYYSGSFPGTPDSATVVVIPFVGGSNPHGNSVVFIDDLSLTPPLSTSITGIAKNNLSLIIYPNPAANYTSINYNLNQANDVSIMVYDASGRLIETLKNEHQTSGAYILNYNTSRLQNGVYNIVIDTDGNKHSSRIIVQQ